jgi:succinate-semialdehyde dehydrogenase/glutarate-semialdehyde dehydrogenase
MSEDRSEKQTLQSRNPASKELLGEVEIPHRPAILATVDLARRSFGHWSKLTLATRLAYVERIRETVYRRRDEIARLITLETGKPQIECYSAELFGVLETCRWLCNNLPALWVPQPVPLNPVLFHGKKAYNVFEPVGVIAVISPWNFPFAIPFSSILMAVANGNTVVLKPSPKTPLVGKLIADICKESGLPDGVVNLVQGDKVEAEAIITAEINKVIFTGSVGGGKAIMGLAARKLHAVTLELGGKHPAIVLADADVDKLARSIVWAAFTNAGQACVSIERLYVVKPVAAKLLAKVKELTATLRLGNGLDPQTDVGPMIDKDQLKRVIEQVADALTRGAKLVCGGRARPELGGYFYEPTVLTDVTDEMKVISEETFGPVLPVVVVADEAEAIRRANQSNVGLGASIWTADLQHGQALAGELQAGLVWINDSIYSHSCPNVPWGGVKESGFGRSHSAHAFLDFVNIKHVSVDPQRSQDWQYPYGPERLELIKESMNLCHGSGLVAKVRTLAKIVPNWLKLRFR